SVDDGTLNVEWWSDDVVRVTYAAGTQLPEIKSLTVVATPVKFKWTNSENQQAYTLASPHIKVSIDKQSGTITFLDAAGKAILKESENGRKIATATQQGIQGSSVAQAFDLA